MTNNCSIIDFRQLWPVKRLDQQLGQREEHGYNFKLSGDRGHFICHYVYETTLNGIKKGVCYGSRGVWEGFVEVKESE